MEKLLIVDGNSLANRAFYALPMLRNKQGEFSNAVYGFCNILIKFIMEQKPDYICVAFDHSRKTFRNQIYSEYKGTRKQAVPEFVSQMPILKDVLKKMNIQIFEQDGIEADDIIGTIAKHSGVKNIILSGDRDVLQLVDENTEVWLTKKGISEVQIVSIENIKDLYSVLPHQVIDLKALMGDASDNIPGVAGIGEKTATALVSIYGSIDEVYKNIDNIKGKQQEKLIADKDNAYMSYKLATIKTDCDITFKTGDFCYDFPFNDDVKDIFINYDFRSLLKRTELFENKEVLIKKDVPLMEEIKITKAEITSLMQLQQVITTSPKKYFAFNFLEQCEFCFNDSKYFVVSEEIEKQFVIDSFKEILQDKNIDKIVFDLKSHMHLSNEFCTIKGDIFDVSIALYLVHAGDKVGKTYTCQEYNFLRYDLKSKMKELGLEFVYNEIEMPLTYVLFEMENNGFYVNKQILNELSNKYQNELKVLTQEIYNRAYGEFNINSPKQVASVLYEVLGLSDYNNKKHSTSIEYLNLIKNDHRIVPLIIRYRKIQKLYSSYIEPYKKIIEEKGECIHTIFNQTLTATGRLSSSEPNLQNIPVREEEGKNLRKMFVSRFEDGQIISADYNQIELRLLAALSEDKNMVEAYKNNQDIHLSTASQIFDKPISEVTPEERASAKATNFGIVYGISAYGLANQIGESTQKAKMFIDKYLDTFAGVKKYMHDNVEFSTKNGYSKTVYGRIRKINELYSSNKNVKQFGERVAMNMPLQGTASDIIKIAMIKVSDALKNNNLKSKLILQIHDELIIDAPADEVEKVKEILKQCMENTTKFSVPLVVSITSGSTWFDAK